MADSFLRSRPSTTKSYVSPTFSQEVGVTAVKKMPDLGVPAYLFT